MDALMLTAQRRDLIASSEMLYNKLIRHSLPGSEAILSLDSSLIGLES